MHMTMAPLQLCTGLALSRTVAATLLLTSLGGAADARRQNAQVALNLAVCSDPMASSWSWDQTTSQQISRVVQGSKLCVAAATPFASSDQPTLQPCNTSAPSQKWVATAGSIAPASATQFVWVSDAGSTAPGQKVGRTQPAPYR